jgi:DNA mismatch repair protein MutL
MNRIRLLSDQVANQIAAGEVVERPASVVKELVENALDARATRIHVEIQAGGRSLIRITDDGIGMSRDDALLCLERHATSKIQRAEDLAAIDTMGFRGEAVPSIASVSRFTLTTRERDESSPEATQIIINGGKILEVKAAGSAPGTAIEVRQLFFNLPARRKFLRTEETESAHIQHYLTLAALAHPAVAFTFQRDGRLIWQLPPIHAGNGNDRAARLAALRERLRAISGADTNLLAVDFLIEMQLADDEIEGDSAFAASGVAPRVSFFRVWGFIGAPGVSRATREEQHVFVNRRPVENRGLNWALMEGYHTALMKGRYPVCCLFVEIDPSAVDVNIHPAKREIKFHREMEVRKLMARAVRETLLKFHGGAVAEKNITSFETVPSPPVDPTVAQTALPNFPRALHPAPGAPEPAAHQPSLRMGFAPAKPAEPKADLPEATPLPQRSARPPVASADVVLPAIQSQPPAKPQGPVPLLDVPLRLVGVIGRLYVLLESDRGLVLLDQHAAHERILFEQMLKRLEKNQQAPSQRLLLPETVELSIREAAFLKEQLAVLTRLGVGLSEFGERTFLLDALPPFVKAAEPRRFVMELVDQLKSAGQEVNSLRLGEHVVAKTVCRHAVKANDPLAGRELENLVEDLRHCEMPYTCPHGRPTLIEMNFRELERKFGRAQ